MQGFILFAKKNRADFCFFQECHSTSNDSNFWRSQWGNDTWSAHGSGHSAGVGIFKHNFNRNILETNIDSSGHFLIMIIAIHNLKTIIINLYGFNSSVDNNILFDTLEEKISYWLIKCPNASWVLGGDFNIAVNTMLDRWPPRRSVSLNSALKCFMDKISDWYLEETVSKWPAI